MTANQRITEFRGAGQGHVFAFWPGLNAAERANLLEQAAEIDLAELARLQRTLVAAPAGASADLSDLEPAPCVRRPEHGGSAAEWARAEAAGVAALRAGRVAAFTVAGGQGTRLGYAGPKGTLGVTPVRGKSLFQVFAEKIAAAGHRYGRPLHWFIMTSHANHGPTVEFFAAQDWFGLDPARVHCFRQGRMPCVDFAGRLLLETPSTLALSPDGHGGALRALERSGALDQMQREGVDLLSYFQVDNPLVRCVDPAFIGFHLLHGSEMSSKMLPKAHPEERLGHFCLRAGRLCVVEYSDMPRARQRETGPDGALRFGAGSIAMHLLDREFARRLATGRDGAALPYHRAEKIIPTIDAAGRPVVPATPNGIKFELFVFDALLHARRPLVLETLRADDFSPVKNATGPDSPTTCRDDQLRQAARWLRAAGVALPTDPTGLPACAVEVSPLFADDAAAFVAAWNRLERKPVIQDGLCLDAPATGAPPVPDIPPPPPSP